MKSSRRTLTADEVETVLSEIAGSVSAIDDNLRKSQEHQSKISDVSARLNDLARRLREAD